MRPLQNVIKFLALGVLPAVASAVAVGSAPIEGASYRGLLDGRPVKFVVKNGVAMHDGDIELGDAQDVLSRMSDQIPDGVSLLGHAYSALAALREKSGPKANVYGSQARLWPRNAQGVVEVPYVVLVDPDNRVPAAIALANTQLMGFMQWIPRTTQLDYVGFNLDQAANFGSCSSAVGRSGGLQRINGSRACGTGTLVHEMGHAVGLWHEQQRDDRGSWLRIDTRNVDPFYVSNYDAPTNQRDLGGLDYGSIMHYSAYGFAKRFSPVMSSIPAGIPFGARDGYSAADIEGMRRLYGNIEAAITVASFPSGQRVIVDGVEYVTPARFNWPLGSSHTLSVPPGIATSGGNLYAFARWSSDAQANLQRSQTVVVSPGDGRLGSPADRPAVSTYTAYFSAIVEVQTSSNVAGGTTTLTPQPETIDGRLYWRGNTPIINTATAPAGHQFVRWGPSSGLFHFSSAANRNSNPHNAPVSTGGPLANWIANFSNEAQVFIRAEDGYGAYAGTTMIERFDVNPVALISVPENSWAWAAGETRRFRARDNIQGGTANIRSKFLGWSGGPTLTANSEIEVTKPSGGIGNSITYTARYLRQFKPYTDIENAISGCGSVTITPPPGEGGFYDFGATLTANYAPPLGFQITRWNGNFVASSPGALQAAFTVDDMPEARPEINTVGEVFSVRSVSPNVVSRGAPVTIEISGTGLTANTEVYVANLRRAASLSGDGRMIVTIPAAELPDPGKAVVALVNRAGTCTVGAYATLDIKASASAANYSDLWWSQENGHGVSMTQKGNSLFMAWYHFDAQGRPTWVVMPSGTWNANFTEYSGDVYTPRGSYFAQYDVGRLTVGAAVGRVTLNFSSANAASMAYSIGGVSGTKQLNRLMFARVGQSTPGNFGDLWFGGAANNGWGVNITQQGGTLFAAWYTYDRNGAATWYVLPSGDWTGRSYTGRVFKVSGAPVLGVPFNANAVVATDAGSLTFTFSADGQSNVMNYSVDGANGSYTLTRLAF